MGQRADDLARREPVGTGEDDKFADSTATAREDIETTRAELSSTIDAIQDRLDPELLSDQAKDTAHDVTDYAIREAKDAAREITDHAIEQAREAVQDITGQARTALREATLGKVETMARTASDTAGGWRQSVVETIKANPMPAALVGLGVGWMLLNRPSSSPAASGYGYGSRSWAASPQAGTYGRYGHQTGAYDTGRAGAGLSDAASGAQENAKRVADQAQQTATEAMQNVQGTAGQVMEQMQETTGQVVDQVQEQASRAQSFLSHQMEENPLFVGAVAVAIGGVLAGTVRSTQQEDQMLGTARDKLMGSAREVTQDTIEKVGRVVDEVQSTATEKARQESLIQERQSL